MDPSDPKISVIMMFQCIYRFCFVYMFQVRELLYFVVFLLIILVAFGTFRQGLWFPDEDFKWDLVREIFLKPYFMLYGEVYADEVWRTLFTLFILFRSYSGIIHVSLSK